MRRCSLVVVGLAVLTVSACHKAPPANPGKGLSLPDVSKVAPVDGKRITPQVARSRSMMGRWTGITTDGTVIASFTPTSVSMEIDRHSDGALVAAASGPIVWAPDGTLRGTLSGVTGTLAPFAAWTASFPTPGHITVVGRDDARLDLVHAMPPRSPGLAGKVAGAAK